MTSRVSALVFTLLSLIAATASAQQQELAEQLARLLSPDSEVQDSALREIVALGESAAADLEAIAIDADSHPRLRSGAIFALGEIQAPSSEAVLRALWGTGFEALGGQLAIQTATALAGYGDFSALEEVVRTENELLGAKAAVQLALRGSTDSLALLQGAYESEAYSRMRPFLAIALGVLGDTAVEPVLRSALRTPELRNHCAVALARLGHAGDVRFELDFAMSDVDPLVRLLALEALIELAPARLDDILESASSDSDPRVAALAVAASERRERRRR